MLASLCKWYAGILAIVRDQALSLQCNFAGFRRHWHPVDANEVIRTALQREEE